MGSRNFKYLDELIHSGAKEIVLDCDIELDWINEEKEYLSGIRLDIDDLIIDGNGHAIDASRSTRIFDCTGKNITIKNFVLRWGFTTKDGGAINNAGTLIIENCRLYNNISRNGGGIHNVGQLTIKDTRISHNLSRSFGGAINNWGKITIENSQLSDNCTKFNGAAIHNNKNGKIIINNSRLSENRFTETFGFGGAIYNDENGYVDITNSALNENKLTKYGCCGGAIYNCGELNVANTALLDNCVQGKMGGAIYNNGKLTIAESTLDNNTAKDGGAIYNDEGELTITDSTLTQNTAQDNGGTIYLYKSKYKSSNCTFKDNNPDDVYEEK